MEELCGISRAALMAATGATNDLPGLGELKEVIREVACARCPVQRTNLCRRCAPLHRQQAQAVLEYLKRRHG